MTGFDSDCEQGGDAERGRKLHSSDRAGAYRGGAERRAFRATGDFREVAGLDAVLICVPTPLYADHAPDMRAVAATIEALARARACGAAGGA